jgi:hypothetical protein
MVADPMLRAASPEMVPESYFTGAGVWAGAARQKAQSKAIKAVERTKEKQRAIVIMKFLSNIQSGGGMRTISALIWLRAALPGPPAS